MTDNLTPEAEVARICRDLIRINSSNYGDGSGPGMLEGSSPLMGHYRTNSSSSYRSDRKYRFLTTLRYSRPKWIAR